MKKILFIGVCLALILFYSSRTIIPEESIRFRVIANSDSASDIYMKEKLVNEVSSVISTYNLDSIDSARVSIIESIPVLEEVSNNLFDKYNYDNVVNVSYGMNDFPNKEYDGITYPAGKYESLVLNIGQATGTNYWCVLYPPLCFDEEVPKETTYKSFIVEFIKKLFN